MEAIRGPYVLIIGLAVIGTVLSEDLVIKVGKYVPVPPNNCQGIEDFFLGASYSIFQATDRRVQFDKILLQVPYEWRQCNATRAQVVSEEAVDVQVTKGDSVQTVQQEGCAIQGQRVDLGIDVITSSSPSAKLSFASAWLKYRFGVFDEHGYASSAQFPDYFSLGGKTVPTACTNKPLTGNYSESCLNSANSCPLEPNQPSGITSSILYKSDVSTFPEISNVCDASTHNKDAPTQHNLLCYCKSAMEIFEQDSAFSSSAPREFLAPNITLVTDKSESEGEFILVIDGALDQDEWTTLRLGLAQFFAGVSDNCRISLIQENTLTLSNQAIDSNNLLWPIIYFPEDVETGGPSLNLVQVFNLLAAELEVMQSPNVIIMTATEAPSEDLSTAIQLIETRKLKVDILTFNNVAYPNLLKLTSYGSVFAIPRYPTLTERIHYTGSVMFQLLAGIERANYQQVVTEQTRVPTGIDPSINGTFVLASHATTLTNPRCHLLLLSPWSDQIEITIVDPDGIAYQGNFGTNISMMWNQHVHYVRNVVFKIGTWKYSVTPTANSQHDDGDLFVVGVVDAGEALMAVGGMQRSLKQPYNATTAYAVSVYGRVEGADADNTTSLNFTAHIMGRDFPPEIDLTLVNDGLVVPDVSQLDHVYSQYFFEVFETGFYATRFNLEKHDDSTFQRYWFGPSFYVTAGRDMSQGDKVPPSRITDFRITTYPAPSQLITLSWTAPGDNLNSGSCNYYKIYCGLFRDDLSFDYCTATRHGTLVMFAHESGWKESLNTTLALLGTQVYFGIQAIDDAGNVGEMSNVALAYVEGESSITTTTTTTQVPQTTSTPSTPPASSAPTTSAELATESSVNSTDEAKVRGNATLTDPTKDDGIYLSDAVFITLMVLLGVFFFLLAIFIICFFCWREKKKQQFQQKYEMALRRQRVSNAGQSSASSSTKRKKSRDNSREAISKAPARRKNRTMTNGSLTPTYLEQRIGQDLGVDIIDSLSETSLSMYTSSDSSDTDYESRPSSSRRRTRSSSHGGSRNRAFIRDEDEILPAPIVIPHRALSPNNQRTIQSHRANKSARQPQAGQRRSSSSGSVPHRRHPVPARPDQRLQLAVHNLPYANVIPVQDPRARSRAPLSRSSEAPVDIDEAIDNESHDPISAATWQHYRSLQSPPIPPKKNVPPPVAPKPSRVVHYTAPARRPPPYRGSSGVQSPVDMQPFNYIAHGQSLQNQASSNTVGLPGASRRTISFV